MSIDCRMMSSEPEENIEVTDDGQEKDTHDLFFQATPTAIDIFCLPLDFQAYATVVAVIKVEVRTNKCHGPLFGALNRRP
jgi:hypothetical protein